MPLYEYQCDVCAQRFEIIQRFSDPVPETCRLCGKGPVRRLMSSPAIQFKGTGWYITDYSQKGKSSESSTSEQKADKESTAAPAAGSSGSTAASSGGETSTSAPAAPAASAKSDS